MVKIHNLFSFADVDTYTIALQEETEETPELRDEIDQAWGGLVKDKPNMKDGTVLFVQDIAYDAENKKVLINAEKKGFSRLHFFNRREENYPRVDELVRHHMLGISTHTHLLSEDGYLLFGTKKNQFDQISGFGGFPQEEDYSEHSVNPYQPAIRSVKAELPSVLQPLLDDPYLLRATGITYVDDPRLRGTDMDFLVGIKANAKDIVEAFEANAQFEKRLHRVEYSPRSVRNFLLMYEGAGKVISPYAIGAEVATMHAFGQDAANMVAEGTKNEVIMHDRTEFVLDDIRGM